MKSRDMNAHAWVENTGEYGLQGQMYTNEESELVAFRQLYCRYKMVVIGGTAG